jgi:dihydroxyacetone kinase-like predicted kinase
MEIFPFRRGAEHAIMGKTRIKQTEKGELTMLTYRYDTQLLIDGDDLDENEINDYITNNIEGDCLLAVGDDMLIKIHYHTNTPWKLLEYCASLGDIYDIVVENMERQSSGLHG